jgi:hypothetical protein
MSVYFLMWPPCLFENLTFMSIFCVRCANCSNGAGDISSPILLGQDALVREYYWRRVHWCANILAHRCPPMPIGNADQRQCANNIEIMFRRFFHVRFAITFGAGCIGVPLVLADYKQDDRVPCASTIFMPIAY